MWWKFRYIPGLPHRVSFPMHIICRMLIGDYLKTWSFHQRSQYCFNNLSNVDCDYLKKIVRIWVQSVHLGWNVTTLWTLLFKKKKKNYIIVDSFTQTPRLISLGTCDFSVSWISRSFLTSWCFFGLIAPYLFSLM